MRRLWRALSVISICLIIGGCSSGQAAADKTKESSEIEDNKTVESTEIAETNTAENAETDLMTYMSSDGFQIKYDPTKAESIEVDEHTVQFKLTGDFSDNNTVTIKYITGKQPEEALYELTEPWGEMDAIERSEGFFPGTSDKWGYWRSFSEKDGDGSVNKTAIAGEYNGGILIFDDEEHMTGDEEKDMAISDELASIIDSITYDNFESQTMFESYVGTFVADEGKITLNEDHTGTLSLQDNIDINWSTHEITAVDGSFNYEFATEGGDIQLNLDDMWIDFKKE